MSLLKGIPRNLFSLRLSSIVYRPVGNTHSKYCQKAYIKENESPFCFPLATVPYEIYLNNGAETCTGRANLDNCFGHELNYRKVSTICRSFPTISRRDDAQFGPVLSVGNQKQTNHRKWHSRSLQYVQVRLLSSQTVSSNGSKIYEEVARLIKSSASNIMVMCGAGISTPSGIPDFRSPGTGLYHNLQQYNLPYPEAIFDINYFMMDPRPFYTLARDLYPGINYKPNIVHYFMRLILEKEKLQKVYTQNIDGLERMAGIPEEKLMEAHGTFARASCTLCGKMYTSEKVKTAVLEGEIPKCEGKHCKGKVKPNIVFFGENLPENFWNYHHETHFTDLLIVIGTSLEVYPFAGIAEAVGYSTPRVLINRDVVGSFGSRTNDYMLLGDLEDCVRQLVNCLGWATELENLQKCS
ncbi:NAD-dependent protein deacetylase sirtuin-3, mitochondrial [Halocaridina rubra]|uniref:NAD-dependent protein deacetylase sirtuin-3, mitochondrial n=1 Tax=Halocaridina rubra TaxID=373956 RepID=A0AAN9AE41_HALRR